MLEGQEINAVLPEGEPVPTDPRVTFDASQINIYEDSHLVRKGS
jgi:glycerol transport system ATP-binding protein